MPANLADEIRRRKVASAITEEDDPNDDPDPDDFESLSRADAQGSPTDSAEDSAPDDRMGEKPAPPGQDEFTPAETVRAGAQKRFNPNAQSLSDYFGPKPRVPEQKPLEPIAPGPVNPSEPGPIAPGPLKPSEPVPLAGGAAKLGLDDEYVTDTATEKKIPRGQLVDPDPEVNYLKGEELRAQIASEQPEEPAGAVQFGKIDVTGEAPEPEVRKAYAPGVTPQAEASEKPKYSVYNIDSGSYTLTMPDGSTRDVPADQFDPSTNEIKPPGTQADVKARTEAAQPAQVLRARPSKQLDTGLYQDEKPEDFISGQATMFADQGDLDRYRQAIASGATEKQALKVGDNGIGNARVGGLETGNLAGVAVPEWVLQSKYGNNYAKWRSARVDVVDPQTGKRLRLPIIDTGPGSEAESRGVVADFTPYVDSYFGNKGGGKNLLFKLVDNAGPDVHENPGLFWDEQAAIKEGFDSSSLARGVQKIQGKLNYQLVPSEPAQNAALSQADAFNQQNFRATIAQLPEADSGNIIGLYQRLDKPIATVPDSMRQEVQAGLKPQIIAAMRKKFPELKTDDEAWAKAQSDVGALDVGREWVGKALGFAQQFGVVMKQGAAGMDQNYVDQFLNHVMPGASDQQKHEYLTKLYAMPPDQRNIEIASKLPSPLEGVATGTPRSTLLPYAEQVSTALQHLADPDFQRHKADEISQFKAQMEHNISDDPRLKGTFMEKVVDATAQMPSVIAAYGNPALWPIALAQAADSVREGFRQEHPEWDSKTLEQNTARATMVQFFGQIAANKILTSGGGALLDAIEGPAKRAIAQAIYGTAGQAAIAGGTQAATNIIGGQPVGQGVGEAALAGGIQGAVGGVVHGVRELGARPLGVTTAPKEETVAPPLVTKEQPQLSTRPLTAIDVLGAEPPKTIAPEQADDVLKVVAHNVFPDLNDYEAKQVADRVAMLSANNLETERFRYELERFLPQGAPYSFGPTTRLMQSYRAFQDGPTVYTALELQRAQDAFNAVRNPQVRVPGALHLPIMWREVEARIPEEPKPVSPRAREEAVPAQGGTTFTTAKGSIYVLHDDGTTTRNKAYHPEHGVADQGLQQRSEQTFFVTPEDAQKLGEIQTRGGPKTVIAPLSGGRFGLKYVEGPDTGKFERRSVVNGQAGPEVGLIPVEMWEGGGNVHFGNEITELTRPPKPVTQEDVARRAYELNGERAKSGQPGTALDDWTQAQKDLSRTSEPVLPATMSEAEPINSAIANRYVQERMATGELGQIDPSQGKSTEDMVQQGLQMSPKQRDGLIDNFVKGKGGDLDQQGAAIRSKEALLSEQARAASRAAAAEPANQELQAQAKAAADAVTAFHNGPIKKFKKDWSNAGRALQREIPLDYTTFNGMKEAYLKGNNKEAPAGLEPKLKRMAEAVSKTADAERVAMNKLGKEIEKQTLGKTLPTDDQIRTRLMEIMRDLPCPT